MTRGVSPRCPEDGVLDSLDDWTACMTWTLDNGTTVLSNFVMEVRVVGLVMVVVVMVVRLSTRRRSARPPGWSTGGGITCPSCGT